MSEERRSGAGASAAMVLFALSGAALTGALLLFLTSVTPGRSDPHGYVMIFSALIGLVCTPVFLLALLLVFGRRPWVRLTVSIIVSFFTVGLGLFLVLSALETLSSVGRLNLTLLVPGCVFLLTGVGLAGSTVVRAVSGRRRRRDAARPTGAAGTRPADG